MTDTEKSLLDAVGPMTYSQQAQSLIDLWNARSGGLDTLRILADVLTDDGDERMASACRDAVRWFEAEEVRFPSVAKRTLPEKQPYVWFNPFGIESCCRLKSDDYWSPRWEPETPWHAIELYADFPPLK